MSERPADARALVYAVPGNHCESYKVEAKAPGFRKVLGTLPTRELALDAFDRWHATGELPPAAKRGPKGPLVAKRKTPSPRAEPPRPKPATPAPECPKARRLALLKQLAQAHR